MPNEFHKVATATSWHSVINEDLAPLIVCPTDRNKDEGMSVPSMNISFFQHVLLSETPMSRECHLCCENESIGSNREIYPDNVESKKWKRWQGREKWRNLRETKLVYLTPSPFFSEKIAVRKCRL